MEKANKELRKIINESRVSYWQIGEVLGVSENTIGRWLRKPLSSDRQSDFLKAIAEIE